MRIFGAEMPPGPGPGGARVWTSNPGYPDRSGEHGHFHFCTPACEAAFARQETVRRIALESSARGDGRFLEGPHDAIPGLQRELTQLHGATVLGTRATVGMSRALARTIRRD